MPSPNSNATLQRLRHALAARPAHPTRRGRPALPATAWTEQRGQAVLVAVLLVAVVMVAVAAALFQGALANVSTSTRAVTQSQALRAAQAGLNVAYQRIQSASAVAAAPCGSGAVSGELGSAPSLSTYSVTTTYFATLTARATLTCAAVKGGSVPQVVELTATGQDQNQTERMASEADLAVAGLGAFKFKDAVYAGPTFTLNGSDTFLTPGETVYVNGNANCTASGAVNGTLIVMGTLTMTGNCQVTGTVIATGKITIPTGSPGVTGKLISTTSKTPGITIKGNPSLHTLEAKTAIKYPSWWHPASGGKIVEDDAGLVPPATQPFPTVKWTPSGWIKAGYQPVTAGSTCAKVYQAIWAMHTARTATGSTLPKAVYTTCRVQLPQLSPNCPTTWGNKYYCTGAVLQRNLAIVSTAGITLPSPTSFSPGTAAGTRNLYLVVPTVAATGATVSCAPPTTKHGKAGQGDINFTGKIYAGIDTLFFTPCTITMSGSATVSTGVAYAGIKLTGTAGMSFTAPPVLPGSSAGSSGGGATGGGSGGATGGGGGGQATVGIVNERQITP